MVYSKEYFKKNSALALFSFVLLFLISCANVGFNQTKSGMSYRIISGGGTKKAQIGDFIVVDLILKNGADSVLENTWVNKRARKVYIQKPQSIRDFNEILLMLAEKDSAVVRIPADSLFKGGPLPKEIKAGSYLTFQLKAQHLIPKDQVENYLKKEKDDAIAAEKVSLDKYIKEQHLNPTVTATGLRYIISKEGNGAKPVAGDTVMVNYTGRLLNGKIFDTNDENLAKANKLYDPQRKMGGGYAPIKFPLGNNQVIKGWEDGLLLLSKGSKAKFLIPSELGYGERGMGAAIGPFSSLVFDVELVDIIKGKPGSANPKMPSFQK